MSFYNFTMHSIFYKGLKGISEKQHQIIRPQQQQENFYPKLLDHLYGSMSSNQLCLGPPSQVKKVNIINRWQEIIPYELILLQKPF